MSEKNNGEQKQKWSSAKRAAYKRYMEKLLKKKEQNGQITVKEFPFKKVDDPEKDEQGKWVIPIHWEVTKEEPVALYGCEEYLSQQGPPCWKDKTIDEIQEDLLKKQQHNEELKEEEEEENN